MSLLVVSNNNAIARVNLLRKAFIGDITKIAITWNNHVMKMAWSCL